MTTDTRRSTDEPPTVGVDAESLERYGTMSADEGDLIIYDREGDGAWIQSDRYAALCDHE